jgi:hypothetical protein
MTMFVPKIALVAVLAVVIPPLVAAACLWSISAICRMAMALRSDAIATGTRSDSKRRFYAQDLVQRR